MTSKQKSSLVRRIHSRLARGRDSYEKADILFTKLLAGMNVGEVVETDEGLFTLVDNFDKSNTAYRVARVARFELKPVKAAKVPKEKKTTEDQPEMAPEVGAAAA